MLHPDPIEIPAREPKVAADFLIRFCGFKKAPAGVAAKFDHSITLRYGSQKTGGLLIKVFQSDSMAWMLPLNAGDSFVRELGRLSLLGEARPNSRVFTKSDGQECCILEAPGGLLIRLTGKKK
jgi:hypothetical protein